jgi:hypothetical protein
MDFDLRKDYETLDDLLNAIESYIKWQIKSEKMSLKSFHKRGITNPYVKYLESKYPENNDKE